MKKFLLIFLFITSYGFAQNSGITYQAVIYNPNGEELPGVNNPYAALTDQSVCLQFGIVDANGTTEYQENVQVTTDAFGMVNLLIGTHIQTSGYAASFSDINWGADAKFLKVDIDINGDCTNFKELSNQPFTYVPFAYYSPASDTPGPAGDDGNGIVNYTDGNVYDGQFIKDLRHGFGVMTYNHPVGDFEIARDNGIVKYDGEWQNNIWHGNGVATYSSGEIKKGKWRDHILVGEWEEIPSVSSPAILTVNELQFQDANQNDLLEANESSSVSFKLKNIGKGTAYAIEINIKEKSNLNGLEYLKEFQIKSLRYNDDEIITIPIAATNNLSSGQASFTIEISEGNGFDANPFNISFDTQEFQAPNVEIVDHQFKSEEGVIRSMLEVNLQFVVQNTGKGEAEDISVIMKIPNNVFVADEVDYKITSLKPGEKRILKYEKANKKVNPPVKKINVLFVIMAASLSLSRL